MAFPTGWTYRRALTDANSTSVTAFQSKLVLSAANFDFAHADADGADIRFWDATTSALLPYWIESYDSVGEAAVIWVKIADITHANEIYYGNSSAADAQSGADTFEFYDGAESYLSLGRFSNAATKLAIPTYEGSGDVVHPSVVYFPSGWNGYKYWMGMTPYPSTNDAYENPSIVASNSPDSGWDEPTVGVTTLVNPLYDKNGGHNMDTCLVYNDETNELWLYWYNYAENPSAYNNLYLSKSSDGVTWSAKQLVLSLTATSEFCPIIKKKGTGDWWMFSRNSPGTFYYRTSTDGATWSSTSTMTISSPPWHFDVIWVPSQSKWYLVGCQGDGTNSVANAWYSADGATWTASSYVWGPTAGAWDAIGYKPALVYDPAADQVLFWTGTNDGGTPAHWGVSFGGAVTLAQFLGMLDLSTGFKRVGAGTDSNSYIVTTPVKSGSGSLKFTQTSGINPRNYIQHVFGTALQNVFVEADVYDDGEAKEVLLGAWQSSGNNTQFIGVGIYTDATYYAYRQPGDVTVNHTSGPTRSVGWKKFGIRCLSTGVNRSYINDVQARAYTYPADIANVKGIDIVGGYSTPRTAYVDNVRVRKYAATEPAMATGSETLNDSAAPVIASATITVSVSAMVSVVNFADDVALNAVSIAAETLTVTGPNGYTGILGQVGSFGSGTSISCTFSDTAIGATATIPTDPGIYTIKLTNGVADAAGNTIPADTIIGTFRVGLSKIQFLILLSSLMSGKARG